MGERRKQRIQRFAAWSWVLTLPLWYLILIALPHASQRRPGEPWVMVDQRIHAVTHLILCVSVITTVIGILAAIWYVRALRSIYKGRVKQ